MDKKETTDHVNGCFDFADKVVASAEDKTKHGSLNPTDRIFIADSDCYGCAWTKPGEKERWKEPNPQALLKAVLGWLDSSWTGYFTECFTSLLCPGILLVRVHRYRELAFAPHLISTSFEC